MDVLLELSVPVAILLWGRWYYSLRLGRILGLSQRGRSAIALTSVFCMFFLFAIVGEWSAKSVKSNFSTSVLFYSFGASWLGLTQLIFGLLGVSTRDDVIERRNPAAAWVVSGQLLGTTFCIAGANVGNGPGPEAVMYHVAISTSTFILSWLLVNSIASIADTITIDRHVGAGIRTCGWLIATGIILGEAVTGDWKAAPSTLRDFTAYGWPAAALALLVGLFERRMRGLAEDNRWNSAQRSMAFAALLVVGAVVYAGKRGIR
jgi:uncharacterized membrane protein YjfL (UPF0719 family)